jgi:tetratricopeptide (TPR) repeat protein
MSSQAAPAPGGSHSSRLRYLVPLGIALVALIAFIPATRGEFLSWDDEQNFVSNPYFRGLGATQLRWMWSTFLLGHYVPVSWMSLGLDYSLWGMNPFGYHLTNLLIHAANSVLVYFVARRLVTLAAGTAEEGRHESSVMTAVVAALLYGVHPLRVESVAWITERRDVLSGFFMLASALTYLRAVARERTDKKAYWGSVLLFTAAVLSKATVITLPAVLLILNVYPLRRLRLSGRRITGGRPVALELAPFAIPALFGMVVSVVAVHPPFLGKFGLAFLAPHQLAELAANVSAQNQFGVTGKLAVSAYSLCFYIVKTILPVGLSPFYEMPRELHPLAPRFLASYAGVVALIVACFQWRRWPGTSAALAIFIVISAPMLGIVQNGPQIAADRYTYHAAPALAILLAAAIHRLIVGGRRYAIVSASLVAILALLTWRQSRYWQNSETLWSRVIRVDSSSALGQSAMASLRYKQGRVDEGLTFSAGALAVAPEYAEAHNDYGVGLTRKGRVEEALAEYRRALAIRPRFDDAENNLGVLLMAVGHADSAVAHYQRALEINPTNADAEVNLGNALVRAGQIDQAIPHYERAVWIKPSSADAHHNWGVALALQSRYAEAIAQFRTAIQIDPSRDDTRDYLEKATKLLRDSRPM